MTEQAPTTDIPAAAGEVKLGGILGLSGGRKWLFLWALWTVLGLSEATRFYFEYNLDRVVIPWNECIVSSLLDLYLWGALSFPVIRITRWIGFGGRRWPVRLLGHFGSAVVFCFFQLFLYSIGYKILDVLLFQKLGEAITFGTLYKIAAHQMMLTALLIYSLIAFITLAIAHYKQYHEEAMRLSQAQTWLIQAQLDTLKMQLHPHFLYNALNTITALILTDPQAAVKMTARLSGLLRAILETEGTHETSLQQEMDFLNRYLEIQQIRFHDRLSVQTEIPSETLSALVPNLILQPLVENAIRHGITRHAGNGTIRISASRNGEFLHLAVADDGPGFIGGGSKSGKVGRGLANTRERLRQLYGEKHQFTLNNQQGAGLTVNLAIPFRVGSQRKSGD